MRKKLVKRLGATFLACCMAVGTLTGCGGSSSSESTDNSQASEAEPTSEAAEASETTEASDETLRIALNAEPTALLAPILTGGANSYVNSMIFDQLVWYNSETGETEPYLATSWEQIDDLTWEFTLRDDVYGHDGSHFTANDVLYTFQIGVEGGLSFYAGNFDVDKFQVIDDYTIQIVALEPFPDLVSLLCVGCFYMTTEAGVEQAGGVDAALTNPLGGTGAYKFVSWEPGVSITLERNEDYWGDTPYYKYVEYTFVSDDTTRMMSLQSGEVDAVNTIAISQADSVDADSNLSLWGNSTLGARFILFNCTDTPLEDVKVRQAIAYAINREDIFNVAVLGYGEMTDTTLSTLNPAYRESENEYYTYDVDKAVELLAEAGYDESNPLSLTISYSSDSIFDTVAEMLGNYLTAVGIEVTIETVDGTSMQTRSADGDYEILLNSANAYTLARGYNCLYGDGGYLTNGWAAWYNEEFDAIVDSQATESDIEVHGDILAEGFELVREEVPVIGLFNDVAFTATSTNVEGLCLNINGEYSFVKARSAEN